MSCCCRLHRPFGGRAALRALRARLVLWRVPVRWYVAAVALPALASAAALSVHLTLGGQHDVNALVPLAEALLLLLSQLAVHLLTEEAGWRGVALPHLRANLGSLPAGVLPGLPWACLRSAPRYRSGPGRLLLSSADESEDGSASSRSCAR